MTLRDNIREAMTKRSKPEPSQWDPGKTPNNYQLDIFLRKAGYRLVDVVGVNVDNSTENELILSPLKKGYLHPDINHVVNEGFYIAIERRYAELDSSDLREVMRGYETALGVVDHLEAMDLNDLESEEEPEETGEDKE